jgi:phosphatidylinositol alpha-1,6-mannosyltransferase
MPSRGEGFGLVYLEAMRHRLPCIASSDDAGGEICQDGEAGFVVKQSDTRELTERITCLLENESLCREMGEAGYRRWRTHYTYRQFEARLRTCLAPLMSQAIAAPPQDVRRELA